MEWSKLIFSPNDEVISEIVSSWGWLIQESFTPLLFSIIGDMFFQKESESVFWLNTGTAEIKLIAESVEHFKTLLISEAANDWFLPNLIAQLYEAGKVPEIWGCYTYVTLPIFAEGKYEVANLNPVPAKEHFSLAGHVHQQIHALPDGTQIKLDLLE